MERIQRIDLGASKNFIERKCISDYWKTRDQPIANSLPQPRRKSKRHEPGKEGQEGYSVQRNGESLLADKPVNDTTNDARKGRKRKRGDADNANGATDQAADRNSKRHLRSTIKRVSQEISTTHMRKRDRK